MRHVSGALPDALDDRIAMSRLMPDLPMMMLFGVWRSDPMTC